VLFCYTQKMTQKPTPKGRPSKADIQQRASLIQGFRYKKDIEDELKLVSQLASGKSVDEDMGGAYLQYTYPSWTAEDFQALVELLKA
jgi:hypothetical protein